MTLMFLMQLLYVIYFISLADLLDGHTIKCRRMIFRNQKNKLTLAVR